MKIVFEHPPTGTKDSFNDFDPKNPDHYPMDRAHNPPKDILGVYIYGIKARVEGSLKFIPIAVGEGNLKKRLYTDHFIGKYLKCLENLTSIKKKKILEKKEIWDFSKTYFTQNDLISLYKDMCFYDGLPRQGRESKRILSQISDLHHLLYFQNNNFFYCRYDKFQELSTNLSADTAVDLLTNMLNDQKYSINKYDIQINNIKLILTLQNFSSNFYYVYSKHLSLTKKENRYAVEVFTKSYLRENKIYTTADSNRRGNISLNNKINIDFSKVNNCFVNVNK